MVIPDIDLG